MKLGPRGVVVGLLKPSFLIAVGLLGAAAVLAHPFAHWMQFKQNKEELPLKNSLGSMDPAAIAPYRVVERHVLEPAVVESLGTERYLSWVLEDTSVGPNDPLRMVHLFVTYYSGGNNLVPHTPDVCYRGSGYQPAQGHENTDLAVPGVGPDAGTIPIRVCTFVKTGVFNRQRISVVYTFHCNGRFVCTRNGVRFLTSSLSNTYAYFSKVEVSFPRATREQNTEGSRKLLGKVLPVLIRDHWPDFETAERRAQGRGRMLQAKVGPTEETQP